ncbi:MAG: histidine phosphatase family protein, partial [Armatimonadetes bacterium]|nr:histidine phosphatase family protein [Armatimonadota bacterium]
MATLILIKHSLPKIVPDVPANQWRLSGEGRQRCEALADRLKAYHPDVIVTSVEPKAQETAEIVAERLGIPLETLPDLHEHDRSGVPFFTPEQFEAAVAGFFAQPAKPVLG